MRFTLIILFFLVTYLSSLAQSKDFAMNSNKSRAVFLNEPTHKVFLYDFESERIIKEYILEKTYSLYVTKLGYERLGGSVLVDIGFSNNDSIFFILNKYDDTLLNNEKSLYFKDEERMVKKKVITRSNLKFYSSHTGELLFSLADNNKYFIEKKENSNSDTLLQRKLPAYFLSANFLSFSDSLLITRNNSNHQNFLFDIWDFKAKKKIFSDLNFYPWLSKNKKYYYAVSVDEKFTLGARWLGTDKVCIENSKYVDIFSSLNLSKVQYDRKVSIDKPRYKNIIQRVIEDNEGSEYIFLHYKDSVINNENYDLNCLYIGTFDGEKIWSLDSLKANILSFQFIKNTNEIYLYYELNSKIDVEIINWKTGISKKILKVIRDRNFYDFLAIPRLFTDGGSKIFYAYDDKLYLFDRPKNKLISLIDEAMYKDVRCHYIPQERYKYVFFSFNSSSTKQNKNPKKETLTYPSDFGAIYNLANNKLTITDSYEYSYPSIWYSSDSSLAATFVSADTLKIFETKSLKKINNVYINSGPFGTNIQFLNDNNKILVKHYFRTYSIYNFRKNEFKYLFEIKNN